MRFKVIARWGFSIFFTTTTVSQWKAKSGHKLPNLSIRDHSKVQMENENFFFRFLLKPLVGLSKLIHHYVISVSVFLEFNERI